MLNLDHAFAEMVATLLEAKDMLQNELAAFSSGQLPDGVTLGRLQQSVLAFRDQADELLLLLLKRDADDGLVSDAEELVDFFEDSVDRIRSLTEAGRA